MKYNVKTSPEGEAPSIIFEILEGRYQGIGFTVYELNLGETNTEDQTGEINFVYTSQVSEENLNLTEEEEYKALVSCITNDCLTRVLEHAADKRV